MSKYFCYKMARKVASTKSIILPWIFFLYSFILCLQVLFPKILYQLINLIGNYNGYISYYLMKIDATLVRLNF